MDLDLEDDVAIVTASTSGLGYGVARAFANEDANVIISGRNQEKLRRASTELASIGDGAVIDCQADLINSDDITIPIDRAVDEFGRIDHLVTNSGGVSSGPFRSFTDEDWYNAFELLTMSVVRTVRAAIPHLEEVNGTLTTITSRSVKEPLESLVLSNSLRMSVLGLSKTLARELAPDVRVNCVLPGLHDSDGLRTVIEDEVERGIYDSVEEGIADRIEELPAGRIGDPIEFGNTVVMLCSERADYVSGEAILIDGGSVRSSI